MTASAHDAHDVSATRITPDPEAPLCSVQQQLEALGYRVTAIQGSGMEVSAEVERVAVTARTITNEQIRELYRDRASLTVEEQRACVVALSIPAPDGSVLLPTGSEAASRPTMSEIVRARGQCAALLSARAALEHNLRAGRS